MINKIFKEKLNFLSEYFESCFKTKKRFPQSIILEGKDIFTSYFFALELARINNCLENREENCTCLNCKWIKEDKHPSIIKVTPLDFKDDASKTVISVKQVEKITSLINEASDYHRFFIFSGAKIAPCDKFQKRKLEEFQNSNFAVENENWQPLPLNKKIFQQEASNALLKSVEEAPDRVTFVFLCTSKEDIISTIVSRSLVFKVPSFKEKSDIDFSEFFEGYPNLKIEDMVQRASILIEKAENEGIELTLALDYMQEYLLSLIKENFDKKDFISEDIKKIQTAKKWLIALVSPKYAIESLFVNLSNEGRNL